MDEPNYGKKVIENAKFYTASAAVYSVLADIEAGEELFSKFLKYALDGCREMNFDALHEIHFDVIPMEPWKQIAFPCDMVDWTKIGFKCGDTIKVFTNDTSIPKHFEKVDCVPQENEPCDDIVSAVTLDEIIPFVGNTDFFNMGGGEHYYGALMGGNPNGYFDVNWKDRVFNFKRTVSNASNVYLEYITDGINYTGQTVIHPYAFRALQLYIHWQRKEYDDRYSQYEAERAQRLFEKEYDKVIVRKLNLSIADIQEALRSGYKQTVKN